MSGKTKRNLQEQVDSFDSEIKMLKHKNVDLAKGLSEKSVQYQNLLKHTELMQEQLVAAETKNTFYKEGFKRIMNQVSAMTMQLVKMGDEVTYLLAETGGKRKVVHSPQTRASPVGKTQAVKPMVSGHTISRPTVKLPRVSTEQLIQMNTERNSMVPEEDISEHVEDEIQQNYLYSRDDNEENNNTDDSEQEENETSDEENRNTRLDVIQEEEEGTYNESLQTGSTQGAVISGVFRDVRVYITPMSSTSVNSPRKKSTFSQTYDESTVVSRSQTNTVLECKGAKVEMVSTNRDDMEVDADEKASKNKGLEVALNNSQNYDPLEGPSTLLNNTNEDLTLSMFRLAPSVLAEKVSTPYIREVKDADKENMSVVEHVTKRRRNCIPKKVARSEISPNFADCIVVLNRLSPNQVSDCQIKTKRGRSTLQKTAERESTDSPKNSFVSGRPQRSKRPKSLKEPSLNTKMRRER